MVRKWCIRIGFGLGILLACLLVPVAIHLRIHRDLPPPDVSDLLVKPDPIPEEENAYGDIVAAGNAFLRDNEISEIRYRILYGEATEEDLTHFQSHLEANLPALNHLRNGLEKGRLFIPLRDEIMGEYPEFQSYSSLGPLLWTASEFYRAREDAEARVRTMKEMVQYGSLLSTAESDFLETIHGRMMFGFAGGQIRAYAREQSSNEQALSGLQAELPSAMMLEKGMRKALYSEFRKFHTYVEKMRKRELVPTGLLVEEEIDSDLMKRWNFLQGNSFTNQPNRTLTHMTIYTRYLLDNLGQYDDSTPPYVNQSRLWIDQETFLEPNQFGWVLSGIAPSPSPIMIRGYFYGIVDIEATRILLALRRYELAHGTLPNGLLDLVPKFLDEIPLDPFDGKPFRFLPDRRLVYSVGEDMLDGRAVLSLDSADDGRGAQADLVYFLDQSWEEYLDHHFKDPILDEQE